MPAYRVDTPGRGCYPDQPGGTPVATNPLSGVWRLASLLSRYRPVPADHRWYLRPCTVPNSGQYHHPTAPATIGLAPVQQKRLWSAAWRSTHILQTIAKGLQTGADLFQGAGLKLLDTLVGNPHDGSNLDL